MGWLLGQEAEAGATVDAASHERRSRAVTLPVEEQLAALYIPSFILSIAWYTRSMNASFYVVVIAYGELGDAEQMTDLSSASGDASLADLHDPGPSRHRQLHELNTPDIFHHNGGRRTTIASQRSFSI